MSGHSSRACTVSSAIARPIPGLPSRDFPDSQPRMGTIADHSAIPASNTVRATLAEWLHAYADAGGSAGDIGSQFSFSGHC